MKNNKGFSLVELIIVIAIMAILVGVMAPQLIRYIEKTNVASDTQLCDTVRSAIQTAMLDPDVVTATDYSTPVSGALTSINGGSTFQAALSENLGMDPASVSAQLKSKSAKNGTITVSIIGDNRIIVGVSGTTIQAGN